jgi:hypothetical protein
MLCSLPVICCRCGERKPGTGMSLVTGEYSSGICPPCFLELYRADFDDAELEDMHRKIVEAWERDKPEQKGNADDR